MIRTDIGLNVTVGGGQALPGRLALVTQSGAICSALIDFATPLGIGFSSVLALGGALDVDFGELLDFLLVDPHTDGILLYLESLHDARRFLSVLRAAARTKPIIVLKAGRNGVRAEDPLDAAGAPSPDKVFSAALQRAGTVRVETYTQLFAAARILALGRIPRGDRLAIVTNGRGPGLMAADAAARNGIPLAEFTQRTFDRLNKVLPADARVRNPLDVRGTAPPAQIAAAVEAVLADENTDAVAVLHVPLPASPATDTARAVAAVARGAGKLVLASWMGAVDRNEARQALEAGGIANFYTPENAVDAYSFLAAYRRNQRVAAGGAAAAAGAGAPRSRHRRARPRPRAGRRAPRAHRRRGAAAARRVRAARAPVDAAGGDADRGDQRGAEDRLPGGAEAVHRLRAASAPGRAVAAEPAQPRRAVARVRRDAGRRAGAGVAAAALAPVGAEDGRRCRARAKSRSASRPIRSSARSSPSATAA